MASKNPVTISTTVSEEVADKLSMFARGAKSSLSGCIRHILEEWAETRFVDAASVPAKIDPVPTLPSPLDQIVGDGIIASFDSEKTPEIAPLSPSPVSYGPELDGILE